MHSGSHAIGVGLLFHICTQGFPRAINLRRGYLQFHAVVFNKLKIFLGAEKDIGGLDVMFITAIVICAILTLLTDLFCPLNSISGKADCLGQIICLLWGTLFIAGLSS